ncbi:apolipoprotein D-like isoform X2 [Panulirus ornatus]|uniref:apolipoprotein D-like isoform X2 n=1 Tax=Panulirus ornatus TaxID=150431 RepID=UPI003A88C487
MRVSLLAVVALAAVAHAGICPKYPIIRDFDFHRYMGLWYQQDKRQASWEAPGRCWKTLYSRDRKNGQFKMKMIFKSTITDRVEEYDSQLTLQGPSKPSLIKYTIPLTFMEDEFQVLATDYESFSLEYKCDPNGLLEKSESIWLLTREKNPSPLVLQRAYAILHHLGIDIRKLERVDQTCGGIDIVNIPTYTDYDYYNANLQVTGNRRYQQQQNTQGVEYFQYDDYFPQDDYHASSNPAQQSDPSTHFAVSYPPQPTDSNVRRTQQQPHRKQFHLKRQTIPTDERITLGQSLATRLWHVLHTPVSK